MNKQLESLNNKPYILIVILASKKDLKEEDVSQLNALIQNERMNWDAFFEYIRIEKVRPLICHNLIKYSREALPQEILPQLKALLTQLTIGSLRKVKQLNDAMLLFQNHQIAAIPWKGAMLSQEIFNNPTVRESVDLDILIHPKDLQKAKDLLLADGYFPLWKMNEQQEKIYFKNRHSYEMLKKGVADLELHWRIAKKQYMFNISMDDLWKSAVDKKLATLEIKYPNKEHLLVGVAIHHGGVECWLKYKLLVDWYYLLEQYPDMDWQKVLKIVNKVGMRRIIVVGTLMCHHLFGAEIPAALQPYIKKKEQSLSDKLIQNLFESDKIQKQSSILIELRERWYHKILVSLKNFYHTKSNG